MNNQHYDLLLYESIYIYKHTIRPVLAGTVPV